MGMPERGGGGGSTEEWELVLWDVGGINIANKSLERNKGKFWGRNEFG